MATPLHSPRFNGGAGRGCCIDLSILTCLFLLTETWLQGNISDNSKIKEMMPCTHDSYRLPRKDKTGGGVGVFVSKAFTNVSIKNEIAFE